MPISVTCQRCGNAVTPEAPQGLCPACLLEQGMRDSRAGTNTGVGAGVSAKPADAGLEDLSRLFPQLEILELLGRGGMGVVYKARQRGLDRLIALKLLPAGIDRDEGFRDRFVREARALARLNHPNIVAVYDFGQVEGRFYFVMEYVDGLNLRRMLEAGHLSPQQAMAIVPQLCDALQFAHEEGIVHRDIKPENILLDRKGRVKIADFGLAKLLGESLPRDLYSLTGPRQVVGTPHYMAPEQLERPATVDHRADIYSLGVVFYEMLTGELPLGRFAPPSRKVQVDVRLDEVVLRTLEKEPEQRYQRAGEVKTQLASLSDAPPTWNAAAGGRSVVPPGGSEPASRISRLAIAGALVALLFPLVLLAIVAQLVASGSGGVDEPFILIGMVLVYGSGLLCALTSSGLGVMAIRQIRRSDGRLRGMPLALFDAVLYPLLLLDGIIVAILVVVLAPPPNISDRFAFVIFLLTVGLDVYLVRMIWRRVARPSPAPHLPPPGQYALRPRAGIGCVTAAAGAAAVVLVLVLAGLLLPYFQRARQQQARIDPGFGGVYSEPHNDSALAEAGSYRFHVRAPLDCKTTLWAELWRDGKQVREPGFDGSFWVIPPAGQVFDGSVTYELVSREPGEPVDHVKSGWRVTGASGSYLDDKVIPDPFARLPLRDSTWDVWSGQWGVAPNRTVPLLVLRGGKHELPGSPGAPTVAGAADVEVRVFLRFDPLVTPNHNPRILFGQTPTLPTTATSDPAVAPAREE